MNGIIYALAVDSSNNVYAGGEFTTAGGNSANYIAKWDGTSWSSLGSGSSNGTNGWVTSIAVDSANKKVYVCGNFSTAGGKTLNGIAVWDAAANTWNNPIGEVNINGNGHVSKLLFKSSTGILYAGGDFDTIDNVEATGIAQYTISSKKWAPLDAGVYDYGVQALAFDNNGSLYAGGDFTLINGNLYNCIGKWTNGWQTLSNGVTRSSGEGAWVRDIVGDTSGAIYAGGYFDGAGGNQANFIAKYSGNGWTALGSGLDGQAVALANDSSNNLYVGGIFTKAGGKTANGIAVWNPGNQTWTGIDSGLTAHPVQGRGYPSVCVYELAIDSNDNVYAGGDFMAGSSNNIAVFTNANSGSGGGGGSGDTVPLYRYWNGIEHFYTTNGLEIGSTTAGTLGNYGYTCESIQCYVNKTQVSGTVPLYRYWNGTEHFYTTNGNEIGTTTAGTLGNCGYTCEGIQCYVYQSQANGTVPLYRYWNGTEHFYTTNGNEIGTVIVGAAGNGYTCEGIQCYVLPAY
jgi:hypothetical protein